MSPTSPSGLLDTPTLQSPGAAPQSLEAALQRAQLPDLLADLRAAERSQLQVTQLANCPILAVFGQLNAGKSSVVASFLSPEGRQRLPRGEGAAQGTHRFVYWVPQSWLNDPTTRQLLLDLLAQTHGQGVEFLEKDPTQAAAQYRSGRDQLATLSTPLLAGDPALEPLGVALLDCPDVQTEDHGTESNARLDFLAAAARLSSAFLVVWRREALRDRLLSDMLATVRARMPDAPLYLLINLIRPEPDQPQRTLQDQDLKNLVERFEWSPSQLYGAFDFRIESHGERPGWRDFTPPALVERFERTRQHDGDELPQFFALHPPQGDLPTLAASLESGQLQQQKAQAHQRELHTLLATARESLQTWSDRQREDLTACYRGLLDLCHHTMRDRTTGEPLQIPSTSFTRALNESFTRTAPPLIALSLKVARPFERAVTRTRKIITSLDWKRRAQDLEETLQESLQLGSLRIAHPDLLARDMRSQRWCPPEPDLTDLEACWKTIVQRFNASPIESFDQKALDQMTHELWESFAPWKKVKIGARALFGAVASLAAVGGLMTAAVDGGATIYAATAISSALHGGAALAVGSLGAGAALLSFQNELLDKNTLPYLSRLFALACDAFGLPRRLPNTPPTVEFGPPTRPEKHTLPETTSLPETTPILPLTNGTLWELTPEFRTLSLSSLP